jgi:hypothetical protein
MTKASLIILVAFATASGVASFDVQAQSVLAGKKPAKKEKCYSSTDSKKEIPCNEASKQSDLYPNATREMPAYPESKIPGDMTVLSKTDMATDPNGVVTAAQRVYNNSKASTYEKSVAAYMMSSAYRQIDKTNNQQAIDYAIIAIQLNALSNNLHYQLMDILSFMLLQDKKYEESAQYSTRLINETKTQNITTLKTQGNALYRLGRYAEAITPLQKAYESEGGSNLNTAGMLLECYTKTNQKAEAAKIKSAMDSKVSEAANANPGDKNAQAKLLSTYASSAQYAKAAALFDEMNAKGQIETQNEYEAGYISHVNLQGHEAQTIKIINEGIEKKIIQPSSSVYQVLGQANYFSNNAQAAIAAWTKGAEMSKDGEQDLLLAQVLGEENEYTKSRDAAKKALSKGVKEKGEAYIVIAMAESEFGLNNKTAMIDALTEAAKYPESKDQANKLLKQAGVK